MKLIRNTLFGLYINLFAVIMLILSTLWGLLRNNSSHIFQSLLIAAVVISCLLNFIFAVRNFINTCRLYKKREYNSLRKHMKVLKLGVIPYFILNFIIYILLFLLFFAASRGIVIFTPIPLLFIIPIFFTYLSVLFTSCYGIGFAAIVKREKNSKSSGVILHVLFQLCFILDVISTIILLIKYKAEPAD